MSDVIEFPNSCTPAQREECDRCMGALETLAERWAEDVNLPAIAKNIASVSRLSPKAPPSVREEFTARQERLIADMIEQAWIEGALHGCTGAFDAVRAGYVPKPQPSNG